MKPIFILTLLVITHSAFAAEQAQKLRFNWSSEIFGSYSSRCLSLYQEKSYQAALPLCKQLAEDGDKVAEFILGTIYFDGLGDVTRRISEGIGWYQKSAEKNFIPALKNLGAIYEKGEGVPANAKIAAKHFEKAASLGDVESQYHYGQMLVRGIGVPKDLEKAFSWFKKAADGGDAKAQSDLGVFYFNGIATTRDNKLAKQWFEKSAMDGEPMAQKYLALIHANGIEAERSLPRAYAWMKLASKYDVGAKPEAIAAYASDLKKLKDRMTPDQMKESETLVDQLDSQIKNKKRL